MTQPIGNGQPHVIPPSEPAPAAALPAIAVSETPGTTAPVVAANPPTPSVVDTMEVTSHRTVMVRQAERENHTPRLAASIFVGSAMGFALSPLDVVTSRQRLCSEPVGFWREGTNLANKHGIRGFFIGASLGVAGGLGRTVTQGFGISWMQSILGEAFECSPKEPLVNALAVATSAALDPVLTAPPHRLRILMMSDKYSDINSVRQAYAKVAADEGPRIGLYKGFMTNVLRSTAYVGMAFGFSRVLSHQLQPEGTWQRFGVVAAGACGAELVTSPLNVVFGAYA